MLRSPSSPFLSLLRLRLSLPPPVLSSRFSSSPPSPGDLRSGDLRHKVNVQLDFYEGPQFNGLLVAKHLGLYAEHGVDLRVLPLESAGETASEVRAVGAALPGDERATVGTTDQNILIPALRASSAWPAGSSGAGSSGAGSSGAGSSGRPPLPVVAIASMFGRCPLSVLSLPSSSCSSSSSSSPSPFPSSVGVHSDSLNLFRSLMPAECEVRVVDRADKCDMLARGEVEGVQAYDGVETLAMSRSLDRLLKDRLLTVRPLDGMLLENGEAVDLGYSQVVIANAVQLAVPRHRAAVQSFLAATFAGWSLALHDPSLALSAVQSLTPPSPSSLLYSTDAGFLRDSIARCSPYALSSRSSGLLGAISLSRWSAASSSLGGSGGATSFDSSVYSPDSRLVDGDSLAFGVLRNVKRRAAEVAAARDGLKPRLAVVTVGGEPEGHSSNPASGQRLALAPPARSWFDKPAAGAAHNVTVTSLNLPSNITTASLLEALHKVCAEADGVQLMWPLPSHIDSVAAYGAIPDALDVDGANYVARSSASGGPRAKGKPPLPSFLPSFLPVTPAAVLLLLSSRGLSLSGKTATVIGRSRTVGSPLAHALTELNATVTLAHTGTRDLKAKCLAADLVVSCAGVPGVVTPEMISPGCAVISVGVSFDPVTNKLLPDLAGTAGDYGHADLLATSPGGLGPLPVAILLQNVAEAAGRRAKPARAEEGEASCGVGRIEEFLEGKDGWSSAEMESAPGEGAPGARLSKTFFLPSHLAAASLLSSFAGAANELDHHVALSTVEHMCERGVRVKVELWTTAVGSVTESDLALAEVLDAAAGAPPSSSDQPLSLAASGRLYPPPPSVMNQSTFQFWHGLPDDRIARFPAEPRGTSKLLVRVPGSAAAPALAGHAARTAKAIICGGGGFPASEEELGGTYDVTFADISEVVPSNAHMVFNESRVFAARLFVPDEVLLLAPLGYDGDPVKALESGAVGQMWRAMMRGRYAAGATAEAGGLTMAVERVLCDWIEEGETDGVEVALRLGGGEDGASLAAVLDAVGKIPIPPYFNRPAEASDAVNYQTVYSSSSQVGSVAAPTAGLHFTPSVLAALAASGVRSSSLALHVGAGTFKPVAAGVLGDHCMHEEKFSIGEDELGELAKSSAEGRPIVPVGTTSARVLESLYHLAARGGVRTEGGGDDAGGDLGHLQQWEGYYRAGSLDGGGGTQRAAEKEMTRYEALALLQAQARLAGGRLHGSTSLCVAPTYRLRVCDAIVTNFHAPDSTLMCIVSAFLGSAAEAKRMYGHALEGGYRFLSYGDSCFIAGADRSVEEEEGKEEEE